MRPRRSKVQAQAHSGQMVVVFALTLVVLIGALALGVDLSRLRTEAENAQHAANAAALAGVPFLATSQATAFTRAQEEAAKNGMANGAKGVVVTPATVSGYNYRLRVSISEPVTLFFAHVLGLGPMRISRTATAEFLPPLGLGSPDYVLGYPAFPTTLITGTTPENFYLNSSGPYEIKENGEPYSPFFESYPVGSYGSNADGFHYNSGHSVVNPCLLCQVNATAGGSGGTLLTQNVLSHPPTYFSPRDAQRAVVSVDLPDIYERCFCYETIGRFVAGDDHDCTHPTDRGHADLSTGRSVCSSLVSRGGHPGAALRPTRPV